MASALASTSTSTTNPTIPAWIANRLAHLDLNHSPVAKYFEHLAHEGTVKASTILVETDKRADALNLDDMLFDVLVAGLGLT